MSLPLMAPGARDAGATPCVVLQHLALRDFRNFAREELDVPREGLAIVGDNGHGKTNLLEAVYYLQLLRSFRGARDPDLTRFGTAGFHVAADGAVNGRPRSAAVGFERAGKRKRVRVDGAEPARLSDALGALPAVIFSPADVALVAGAPSERRRFLDVALALTSRRYLAALQAYRGALVRRNAALRDLARRGGGAGDRAAVWEPALAGHGAILWRERIAWVAEREPEFTALCAAIGERGVARMRYESALASADDLESVLLAALEGRREQDLRRGLTGAGPHRDDLGITLETDEGGVRDLRVFGSAGQQRTAAIALRMLEAATLRDRGGSVPLLLLDDPFAELDAGRAHRILGLLGESGMGQTLLVVPREADIPRELTRLERRRVVGGEIRRA